MHDHLCEISSFVETPVGVHLDLPNQQVGGRLVSQGAGGEVECGTVGLAVGHLLKEPTSSDIS